MRPGGIRLCTQQSATGHHLEPDESNSRLPILFLETPLSYWHKIVFPCKPRYSQVFLVFQFSTPKSCMHFFSPLHIPHVPHISSYFSEKLNLVHLILFFEVSSIELFVSITSWNVMPPAKLHGVSLWKKSTFKNFSLSYENNNYQADNRQLLAGTRLQFGASLLLTASTLLLEV